MATPTKLKTVGPIVSMAYGTGLYAASALLTDSFTVPANCGGIWCYPNLDCYYNMVGTASATSGPSHLAVAGEPFYIPTAKIATVQIFAASAITLIVAYMRGSRPATLHAVARPY